MNILDFVPFAAMMVPTIVLVVAVAVTIVGL